MNWKFEPVAGPFKGALGGVAWDGSGMLVSLIMFLSPIFFEFIRILMLLVLSLAEALRM